MEEIENLVSDVHSLLDKGEYVFAKDKIAFAINNAEKGSETYDYFMATIAGLLIDLGAESIDKKPIVSGIKILKENEEIFKAFMSAKNFNYNMGNGIDALYKIQMKKVGLPTLESIRPNLTEAKNFYFKAYKEINFKIIYDIDLQILTNLSNNLSQSGRIIEAIRIDNAVLLEDETFPRAIIGLAENLDYWVRTSYCSQSISLYFKIHSLYNNGLKYNVLPPIQKQYYEGKMLKYENLLNEYEFDFNTAEIELKKDRVEYEQHSDYRKFCIDNFLTLNEHSIYCKCIESEIDDLSIIHSAINLFGEKVGKMELLLNRLKSEFALARKLYYEGITEQDHYTDVSYSELMEGELIGEENEKIRTSFKLCFGIFDKIAHGICYFFDLPKANGEAIYFNSFWESKKCPGRWNILKDLKNPHLVALFSIANDFNNDKGEFHFYRQWRNKLEHNNLVLVADATGKDLFKIFDDESFITKITYSFFKEQALHLLQICCSAIYSYAYIIRSESLVNKNENLPSSPFFIQAKVKY